MASHPSPIKAPSATAVATDVTDSGRRVLTVTEVAAELRCSKAHVHNIIRGKVPGVTIMPTIRLGRRRVVRRTSLNEWMETNEHAL